MSRVSFWTLLSIVNYAAVALTILYILRTRRDPKGMMAWILALLFLPVVGLFLFLVIGQMPIQRRVRRRHHRRRAIEPALHQRHEQSVRPFDAMDIAELDPSQRALIRVATRISESVVTRGNDVIVYHDPEALFLSMSLAIEAARSHIHLQYYIFSADDVGRAVRDLLVKKAKQGVEVRLLLDAVGCWRLSRSFVRQMQRDGLRVAFFLPWGLTTRRLHMNFRNHRKLVVVDGRVGFAGSQNIGDVYLGRKKKYGPWRDTHLKMTGPAVSSLQEVFVDDWHFSTNEDLAADRYFPAPSPAGDKLVQIVASGPDHRPHVMHQLLYAALADARHSVSLITPYFVPDHAMLMALQSAAYRGVRVRLLLPARSDHWFVLWAGRSFYHELFDAGIEVYEYDRGMLHSKVAIIDRRWAMVGSANMDVRSFRLNFELTSLIYDAIAAEALQLDFDTLREAARRVVLNDIESWNYRETLAAGLARLASPIL